MKKGLILEGGAMRGLFTAGVMDVLMENEIAFDGAIGVSAGAAFGCNYKSKQIGRVLRYNTRFCADKRYGGIGVFLKTGNIYSTDFAYGEVPLKHDVFDFETYESNPMEFYVVATDLKTGSAIYHRYDGYNDHCFDWIRASASMPLVSKIVNIDGYELLDGGVADSIPIRYFESIGFERNIVILTRPKGYRKSQNKLLPIIKIKYRGYPNFIKTMASRHRCYNDTLDYIELAEKDGKLLIIRPDAPLPVSKIEKNPDKLKEAYNIGRKLALQMLPMIKAFITES